LDIAWEDEPIKVCTHYLDKKGKYIPYQPGVEYQKNAIPQYIELPGWDGEQVHKAKSLKELPKNALKYLSFVQKQIGVPIVAITNGPERKHLIEIA
jgi:adenylosuccinate synthase